MAYSGTLLKINNTTINGLSGYKIGYNKLWKDADRNKLSMGKANSVCV